MKSIRKRRWCLCDLAWMWYIVFLRGGIHNVSLVIPFSTLRERERVLTGGGEVFFMRSLEDLSATDSHLVLIKYCEEHPPLVMATGMSTKIKNY